MCIRPKGMKDLYFPVIYLNNIVVKVVTKEKYLGGFLADDNSDDEDLFRQTRRIYARCNVLSKNFKCCTEEIVFFIQILLYWFLLWFIMEQL